MDTGADMDSSEAKVWTSLHLVPGFIFLELSSVYDCHLWPVLWFLVIFVQDDEDYDVMQDPEFLQSVLENLPGVDPNNEAIRNAMGSLASQTGSKPDTKKDEEKKKWCRL